MNRIKICNSNRLSKRLGLEPQKNNSDNSVNSVSNKLVDSLLTWFCANARDLPWRRISDPYAIWVSEIMLQQTQVKTVIPYWKCWMRELPNIQSLADAPSEKTHKLWEGLGYYTRVRNMQKAAQIIVEKFKGKFPNKFEDVLALPGIGRYTAGAICSIAFNEPTPILDGNVIRVLARVFGISGNPKDKTANARLWKTAAVLVQIAAGPECNRRVVGTKPNLSRNTGSNFVGSKIPRCSFLNQSLMELGAMICTPRQPRCESCPIQKNCFAHKTGCIDELPTVSKRVEATQRKFVALIVERNGQFLVRQRPAGVVNAHLWEFPNVEVNLREANLSSAISPFELSKNPKPLCRIRHSITRYRITLEAFDAALPNSDSEKSDFGHWLSLPKLQRLAFSSAHKKVLQQILLR